MLRLATSLFEYRQPLRTSLQLLIVFIPSLPMLNCGHLFCLCRRTSPPGDTHGPHSHFSQIEIFFVAYELSRRMPPLLLSSRPKLCGGKNYRLKELMTQPSCKSYSVFFISHGIPTQKKFSLCFRRVSRRFACRFSK